MASLTAAVNDHGLKLSVALKDPDLEALRERREWLEGLANMRGAAAAWGARAASRSCLCLSHSAGVSRCC